jgi:hypothetical protein
LFNASVLLRMETLMLNKSDKLIFSVSRNDLLFNYAESFEEIFRFSPTAEEGASSNTGVRLQEVYGYDFQNECSPFIEIAPPGELISKALEDTAQNYLINITLEDIGLGIRKVVYTLDAAEIDTLTRLKIDLTADPDFGLARGFLVNCLLTRKADVDPDGEIIWSKSQIVHSSSFIVKSSIDEALFEIAWTTFHDHEDRKNVLYYVDWLSNEVSSAPHTECFQVKANNDLKTQFKRLESNRHFGELCIRMMADRIVADLAENTLRCAELDVDPLEGSLHEKLKELFATLKMDFDEMAISYQDGQDLDRLRVVSEVAKAVQRSNLIASTLSVVKFGGYR